MGRHLNADSAADDGWDDAGDPEAGPRDTAAHDRLLEPQAVISPDTHVGTDFEQLAPGTADAEPSPANPDALVERGVVGDGHEME